MDTAGTVRPLAGALLIENGELRFAIFCPSFLRNPIGHALPGGGRVKRVSASFSASTRWHAFRHIARLLRAVLDPMRAINGRQAASQSTHASYVEGSGVWLPPR